MKKKKKKRARRGGEERGERISRVIERQRTSSGSTLSTTILTSDSHALITPRGGRGKEYLLASFIGAVLVRQWRSGGFFHGDNAVLPVQEGRNNRFCETRACPGSVLLRAHAIHYTCFMDLVAWLPLSFLISHTENTFFQLALQFFTYDSNFSRVPILFPFSLLSVSCSLEFLSLRLTHFFPRNNHTF